MSYFLSTERLGFSTWQREDLPLATVLWGNPEVTKYICASGVFSEDDIENRLRLEIDFLKENGVQYYPLYLLENDVFIGCCGLHPHGDMEYELGFHLLPDYWHKGYAFEAGKALIEYLFTEKNAESIFAGHNPNNMASKSVLEKLGFIYIGDEYYEPTGLMHPSYRLHRWIEKSNE